MAAERQKVWRWENRGVTPGASTQIALAALLGVSEVDRVARPWPDWLTWALAEADSAREGADRRADWER